MKKILLFALIIITSAINAQMLLPEFEAPKKLEALNSEALESMPLPFNNGSSMYYFRTYTEGTGAKFKILAQDIWFSEKNKESVWEQPYRLFRADYLPGDNSVIGTSTNGERIYLYQINYVKEGKRYVEVRKLIYLDKKGKDKWTDPQEIIIPNFKFESKYYKFYMNPTGDILMISMSISETKLEEDLYVSLKQADGSWGEVVDLGPNINTRRHEVSPFIAEDGKTLYFSSDGHGGEGNYDIFVTYRISEDWKKWTEPLNLGTPINSSDDDQDFHIGNNKEVFFTSNNGTDDDEIYVSNATGEFKFAHQEALFSYTNLPTEGVSLKVYDIDGNLIDEVQTDPYGNFSFKKLVADDFYMIELADSNDDNFVGSKIYFVDENGKKTIRYIYTEDGSFVNADDIKATAKILGSFNYKELPLENVALVLLDENGFPLDTIYPDKDGKFEYEVLSYDQNFSLQPLNLEDDNLENYSINLIDGSGRILQSGKLAGKGFAFIPMQIDESRLAEMTDEISAINDSKQVITGDGLIKSSWNGKGTVKTTVYFDFAQKSLSNESLEQLNKITSDLKGQKIVLVGHADNVGSDKSNYNIGLMRANAVKEYFLDNKISVGSIEVASSGESNPIASNEDESGRAKNRRVEIVIQ